MHLYTLAQTGGQGENILSPLLIARLEVRNLLADTEYDWLVITIIYYKTRTVVHINTHVTVYINQIPEQMTHN